MIRLRYAVVYGVLVFFWGVISDAMGCSGYATAAGAVCIFVSSVIGFAAGASAPDGQEG